MRVFIGCTEICGLINVYAAELRNMGHTVTTYTESKSKYYPDDQYDIVGMYWADFVAGKATNHPYDTPQGLWNRVAFSSKIRLPLFDHIISKRIFDQHDVFIFLWAGVYLMSHGNDLAILKQKGKKVISILVGSDVRYHAAFDQEFGIRLQWPESYRKSFSHFNQILRNVEKYSDAIFSVPDQMGLAIRPYYHFQLPLNLEKYRYQPTGRDVPIVVHAPSNSSLKGTSAILETLNKLKAEGLAFETRFIQNMPNKELLQLLSESDILVDELVLHGPGMLSFEAMASGCAVATCYFENSPAVFRPPVCSINAENLYENVKRLIVDKPYREKLIQAGRHYVEQNNSVSKVVQNLLYKAEPDKDVEPDYKPLFFRERFQLPAGEKISAKDKELNSQIGRQWLENYALYETGLRKRNLL